MKKRLENFLKHLLIFISYSCIVLYAVIFNNTSGWFMFYFVTTLFFFNLLAILPRFKELHLKNKEANFFNSQMKTNLELTLHKRWSVPGLGVRVEVFPNHDKEFFLNNRVGFMSTGKKEIVNFQWLPLKRGTYDNLSLTVITSDFFKFFSTITTLKLDETFYVLPKKNTKDAEKLYEHIIKIKHLENNQRALEVKKYRSYQDGDSWRLIDWNLSAKNRELIIKEFDVESNPIFQLIFLGAASPNFEEMLSCYYSFQKKLGTKMEFEQLIIGLEGCFSYQNSEKIFAWLNPFHEMPPVLTGMESINKKIILIFLTSVQEEIPASIKKLQKRNLVYYVSLYKGDLVLRRSKK